MLVVLHLASQALPAYSCKFSRLDFTLTSRHAGIHMFVLYGAAQKHLARHRGGAAGRRALVSAIGMHRAPDHNILCRAASVLLKARNVKKILEVMARSAAVHRALGLSISQLAGDSSMFERHQVSQPFDKRRRRRG